MKDKYIQFRALLSSGDHKAVIKFINSLTQVEVMALNFMAIIDPSRSIQEVKDFVMLEYGGPTRWFKVLVLGDGGSR